MKFTLFAIALLTSPLAQGAVKKPVTLALPDVVKQVKSRNYKVQIGTMRTYQAKANIEKARADLLPRLTIWNIASIILNPTAIIDQITDVAPFLVPNNWTRLEENKILYKAEQEGYRALWSNEVHVTKSLYVRVLFDQKLLAHITNCIAELERVRLILNTQEIFGGVRPGTTREMDIRILGLKEDQANLSVLIAQEVDELSYALGLRADVQMVLAPVAMPNVPALKPINAADYDAKVVELSPERQEYTYFLQTLEYIRKEVTFSFFGASPISRGVAGGIFDAIPATSGIFGKNATMKIVDAQKEILINQQLGVVETVRRQLRGLANQFNSDVVNFAQFEQRRQLAKENNEALLRRTELGEQLNVLEYSENVKNRIQAETSLLAMHFRILTSIDRLQRLTFAADYSR